MQLPILIKALLILSIISLSVKAPAQRSLDSILHSLNNKDVYVSVIIYGSHLGPGRIDSTINRDSARANKWFFIVTSFDQDIIEVAKTFNRKIVIERLFTLMQDTTRDFYANVLLYELLDNRKFGKFLFDWETRKHWIESGAKLKDQIKWQEFISKELLCLGNCSKMLL